MTLTEQEIEAAIQNASPKNIMHKGNPFTASLLLDAAAIRIEDHQKTSPAGFIIPAFDPAANDPERVFGYALDHRTTGYRKDTAVIQSGLTLEQAVAACCDAIIAAWEMNEKGLELRHQAHNKLYEWLVQAPLQD